MAADQKYSDRGINKTILDTRKESDMNIIVAADKNWGIGRNNQLLVSIPADMKMFREETTGKVVVWEERPWNLFPTDFLLRTELILLSQETKIIR